MMTTLNPRALIADDQSDVLIALQILLKSEGIHTETANSPAAVLEKLSSSQKNGQNFDVLLMDMNYARDTTSGNEGLDLLSRIKLLDQALPVVAMTAWGSVELAVEAMQGGLGDFIQKPWNNTRLLEVLQTQLDAGRRLRTANQKRESELSEARAIQQKLIPTQTLRVDQFDCALLWQPANDISGDYGEISQLSERRMALSIGDVSGKGLPAGLLMSNLQAAVKIHEAAQLPPRQLVTQVNHILSQNLTANKFVTFFYGIIDTQTKQLTYTNAGHNAPLLLRRNGAVRKLTEGGILLGVIPDFSYSQVTLDLEPGDQLLLYTDGISEAANCQEEEFGEERLVGFLSRSAPLKPAALLDVINQEVTHFHAGSERDDRTMILMHYDG